MFVILQKELNAFFTSLLAYVIIGFFLLLLGLWMWVFPETSLLDSGYADMQPFFNFSPYVFMFLVPAITMRSFTEDKKVGTLEILLTSPLTATQIIVGKYLASLAIIILMLLLTSIYYFSLYYLSIPLGNIDTAAVIGSYIGLFMLAAAFASIGLFTSSLTESQVIAFLVGSLLCFLLYQSFDVWATLLPWKSYAFFITQLGVAYHYDTLRKGIIDSRDLIYFVSVIFIMLFSTKIVLAHRR